MVDDIKAVNRFMADRQNAATDASFGNSTVADTMVDCDYIMGSTVPNQPAGVFWAVLNRLLIIFQVIFMLLSECGWPYKFFDRYFPVLGSDFGVGALGVFQCLIGAAVLSHHVDDFALVSAFFLVSLGCLNILIGLIFREKAKTKRSITTWKAEKKAGVLPVTINDIKSIGRATFVTQPSFAGSRFSGHTNVEVDEKGTLGGVDNKGASERSYGWGRQGEKAAAKQGMLISRPVEALPPYGTRPTSTSESANGREASQPEFRSSDETL